MTRVPAVVAVALAALSGGWRSAPDPLDALLDDPILARALVGVRVDALDTGQTLYASNAARHVVPASNMKIVTAAVAAEHLGWDFRYRTHLEAAGPVVDDVLEGDLVVTGSGDPSIGSTDEAASPVFSTWVDALRRAGIRRVHGRLVGDDDVFDDEGRGSGWSWDYLTAGYAAPSGGLSYNDNVAVVRARPGASPGAPATVLVTPPGHGLLVDNAVTTGAAGSRGTLSVSRRLGSRSLRARGQVPMGDGEMVRTTAVENPTSFFVGSLASVLDAHGVTVRDGAWDIDELDRPLTTGVRRRVATHESPPLSLLAGQLMKVSQNFYAETLLKTIGLTVEGTGSEAAGRRAVRATLASWGVPDDAVVVYDGSGLSRYNYVTADALVAILTRIWKSETHRGPFVATLPVGAHDGTLASRMRDTTLARRVQAKTGSIANVRALSGYLETGSGRKLVFSIVVNHFTAPASEIDRIVERFLSELSRSVH
ncbi:MAG TPA: D-alanyl-D-alanine carboxypeptidase/D-alanyl-D-alanine-endopeptidase [Vicinamibacterales bacterium]|nr:D-alanyl-D-alanine carboxypeptidase/D-alanyl-D-alanine-endopeptidase [Vicinamibacterales bacterium]